MKELIIAVVVIVVALALGRIISDEILSRRKSKPDKDRDRWRGPDFLR